MYDEDEELTGDQDDANRDFLWVMVSFITLMLIIVVLVMVSFSLVMSRAHAQTPYCDQVVRSLDAINPRAAQQAAVACAILAPLPWGRIVPTAPPSYYGAGPPPPSDAPEETRDQWRRRLMEEMHAFCRQWPDDGACSKGRVQSDRE